MKSTIICRGTSKGILGKIPPEGMPEKCSPEEFLVESVDKFLKELLIKFVVESQEELLVESLV